MEENQNSSELSEIAQIVSEIVREAGQVLVSHRMDFDVSAKDANEIVTPADIEANSLIVEKLKTHFPDYGFSSEEEGQEGDQEEKRFIIDPLDGTTRKVWGMSGYTVSIAEEFEGQVRVGIVFDPEHDELFHATVGSGAFRNHQRIHTSELTNLSEAFITCDWGNKDEKRSEGLDYYQRLMLPNMAARRIVPQFAPANDLIRIAEGRIHGLVCNDTWLEDHAAGALILKEAGGYVTNFYHRKEFDHKTAGIIAACNQEIWNALNQVLFE